MDRLTANNRSQTDLCRSIGVSTSTLTNWKNRNTDPPAKFIVPICEFFDISPYTLLTGEEKEAPAASDDGLTKDERLLLRVFRMMPKSRQDQEIGRMKLFDELMSDKDNAEISKEFAGDDLAIDKVAI
jgi:transcriptional regulator with XRE-family HTH domain